MIWIALLVFLLLWFSLWVRQLLRLKSIINPFPSPNFIKIPDFQIHYQQIGQGPDVVLLHGIASNLYCWRQIATLMKDRFRLTLIDWPGFGLSTKDIWQDYGLEAQSTRLNQILDQLNIEKTFLVGHSMGGAISIWYSHRHPERVRALALISPATIPSVIKIDLHLISGLGLLFYPLIGRHLVRWAMQKVLHRHDLISRESIDAFLYPYALNFRTPICFFKAIKALRDTRFFESIKKLAIPIKVLRGEHDQLIINDDLLTFLKRFSSTDNLICNQNAGHNAMEDDPPWVSDHITRHFLLHL